MSEEVKGVFVQLPNDATDPQWAKAYDVVVGDEDTKKAALWDFIQIAKAIGTPVTGGALDIIGYADSKEIDSFAPSADINPCAVIFAEEITSHSTPLVRQSDAQAQIAALDAEVVRLRAALQNIRDLPFQLMNLPASTMHRIAFNALKGGAA